MTDRGRVSFAGAFEGGVGARAARATNAASPAAATAVDLGPLPQWRLDDLYEGMESPRFAADLARAARKPSASPRPIRASSPSWRRAPKRGRRLFEMIRAYEALQDLMGRIMSYASLLYAGDTSDPARAKFYGDAQEKMTEIAGELLFFELELNRLDDAGLDAATRIRRSRIIVRGSIDIRKERPHQLSDELEQLFLEKSMTGAAAWNRLFDETIASLRFSFDGEELTLEPLLAKLQDPDGRVREAAAAALAKTLGANFRLFTLIMNTLAKDKEISDRWRKFADVADSRHLANRVEREVVEALVAAVTDAYPRLSHRYYALKARWFGKPQLEHWDRNAPLPDAPRARLRLERGARHGARRLSRLFAAHGRPRPAILRRGLDRRAGAARQGAGRLRPSDDAVGAPLCPGQLPRQAARRDDARPRARPRRASGARRAQRRIDGADAADARRDRLGVRRNADLPRAAR